MKKHTAGQGGDSKEATSTGWAIKASFRTEEGIWARAKGEVCQRNRDKASVPEEEGKRKGAIK